MYHSHPHFPHVYCHCHLCNTLGLAFRRFKCYTEVVIVRTVGLSYGLVRMNTVNMISRNMLPVNLFQRAQKTKRKVQRSTIKK